MEDRILPVAGRRRLGVPNGFAKEILGVFSEVKINFVHHGYLGSYYNAHGQRPPVEQREPAVRWTVRLDDEPPAADLDASAVPTERPARPRIQSRRRGEYTAALRADPLAGNPSRDRSRDRCRSRLPMRTRPGAHHRARRSDSRASHAPCRTGTDPSVPGRTR